MTRTPVAPAETRAATAGDMSRADQQPSQVSPLSRTPLRLLLIFLLLLLSSVAWRKGAFYSGGMDSVVVAKAALNVGALALALTGARRGTPWDRFPVGPLPLLAVYLLVTGMGSVLADNAASTSVLIIRCILLVTTVVLTFSRYPSAQVLSALMTAMLLLAGFASVTGVGSLASEGRLYGGIPPLNANEIALLVSLPFLCLVWRCVVRVATWRDVIVIPVLLATVWATGTRTGLAALLLATLLLVLMAARLPVYVFSLAALAVPTALAVVLYTPLVADYATRGDASSMLTLNSRTVAWRAALDYPENSTQELLGVGLSVKEIPVSAMYRTEQILDSTWVSALVQSGRIGTTALVLLVLMTLARSARSRVPWRSLSVAALVLLTLVSVLESGLFDATTSLIAFLCFAFAAQVDSAEGNSR